MVPPEFIPAVSERSMILTRCMQLNSAIQRIDVVNEELIAESFIWLEVNIYGYRVRVLIRYMVLQLGLRGGGDILLIKI
jgi:hypothetical protein